MLSLSDLPVEYRKPEADSEDYDGSAAKDRGVAKIRGKN